MPDANFDAGLANTIPGWHFGFIDTLENEVCWLRLFFLSLLWRAAVTTHPGFATVNLRHERITQLREMLLSRSALPLTTFPIGLVQLHTDGGWHNASPTLRHVDYDGAQVTTYRFYMDGLIAIINDEETDTEADRLGESGVGTSRRLFVMSRPFEGSHQEERINSIILDSMRDHASTVEVLLSRRKQKGTQEEM